MYITDKKVPQLGQWDFDAGLDFGQDFVSPFMYEEPQATMEAPQDTFNWGGFLDTVGKAIDIGGSVYTKYIDSDIQNAQLELAKMNADTAKEQAKAASLQAEAKLAASRVLQAQAARAPLTPPPPPVPSKTMLGLGVGTGTLLVGAGVLAFFMLRKRR